MKTEQHIQGEYLMKLFPFRTLPTKPTTISLPKVGMRVHIVPVRHWLQRQTVKSWFTVTVLEGAVNEHPHLGILEQPEPYMVKLTKTEIGMMRERTGLDSESPSDVIRTFITKALQ